MWSLWCLGCVIKAFVELLAYYVQIKNGSFVCNVIGMIDIQTHKAIYFPMLYGKDMFGYGDLKFRTVIQNDEPSSEERFSYIDVNSVKIKTEVSVSC